MKIEFFYTEEIVLVAGEPPSQIKSIDVYKQKGDTFEDLLRIAYWGIMQNKESGKDHYQLLLNKTKPVNWKRYKEFDMVAPIDGEDTQLMAYNIHEDNGGFAVWISKQTFHKLLISNRT